PSSTLSLHDALPICADGSCLLPYPGYNNSKAVALVIPQDAPDAIYPRAPFNEQVGPNETLYVRWRAYWSPNFHFNYQNTKHFYLLSRSEEHTSELQSRENLVCRLLLEKKKV